MPSDRLSGFSSAFDDLLERSRRELDALSSGSGASALSPTPTRRTTARASASTAAVSRSAPPSAPTAPLRTDREAWTRASAGPSAAARSPAERALDEKLGAGWRYEVLDCTREGGELVVRCRVTAPARGVSRTWYGSAPLSGGGRGGPSGMTGTAGNVRFTLGGSAGAGASGRTHDPLQAEQEAERQAIESALAACARLL